jgi:hypothetical protein
MLIHRPSSDRAPSGEAHPSRTTAGKEWSKDEKTRPHRTNKFVWGKGLQILRRQKNRFPLRKLHPYPQKGKKFQKRSHIPEIRNPKKVERLPG